MNIVKNEGEQGCKSKETKQAVIVEIHTGLGPG